MHLALALAVGRVQPAEQGPWHRGGQANRAGCTRPTNSSPNLAVHKQAKVDCALAISLSP
jgi:hypothetical protein